MKNLLSGHGCGGSMKNLFSGQGCGGSMKNPRRPKTRYLLDKSKNSLRASRKVKPQKLRRRRKPQRKQQIQEFAQDPREACPRLRQCRNECCGYCVHRNSTALSAWQMVVNNCRARWSSSLCLPHSTVRRYKSSRDTRTVEENGLKGCCC